MKISAALSDAEILLELGSRVSSMRLNLNLSQAELAQKAGISKRTLERLEAGQAATQLSGFLRVLRALDALDNVNSVLPEARPSPMTLLQMQGKARKRAGKANHAVPKKPWKWGDEE